MIKQTLLFCGSFFFVPGIVFSYFFRVRHLPFGAGAAGTRPRAPPPAIVDDRGQRQRGARQQNGSQPWLPVPPASHQPWTVILGCRRTAEELQKQSSKVQYAATTGFGTLVVCGNEKQRKAGRRNKQKTKINEQEVAETNKNKKKLK